MRLLRSILHSLSSIYLDYLMEVNEKGSFQIPLYRIRLKNREDF